MRTVNLPSVTAAVDEVWLILVEVCLCSAQPAQWYMETQAVPVQDGKTIEPSQTSGRVSY